MFFDGVFFLHFTAQSIEVRYEKTGSLRIPGACCFIRGIAGKCVFFVVFWRRNSNNLRDCGCAVKHSRVHSYTHFHACRYRCSDEDAQTDTFANAHAHTV